MRTRKHQGERAGRRLPRAFDSFRVFATLAAFAAVFAQSFIVQTHVDFIGLDSRAPIASHATREIPAADQSIQATRAADAACIICQALATSGNAINASTAAFRMPLANAGRSASADLAWVRVRPGYSWQSRAPPLSL